MIDIEDESHGGRVEAAAPQLDPQLPTVGLHPDDDWPVLRYRLGWMDQGRVALVLPWDGRLFSRSIDFDLLRREAERRQLEIAIVSPDPEVRALARGCGFPAFASVEAARAAPVWRYRLPDPVEPPPLAWWEEQVNVYRRRVRLWPRWVDWIGFGLRLIIFLLVIAILATTAYLVVPWGTVTLVPAGREFSLIVPVSVQLDMEGIDHANGLIPARRLGVEVGGYAETETTGVMSRVSGRASGTVLFTNLLPQNYQVPAGTIVRTSSTSFPIRFRTTADVVVPAGSQATAPIEALEEGLGNVGAFQINRVEGVAASALRVINPEPTTGAEAQDVRVVTQADYDRLRLQLMNQLLDQAYDEIQNQGLLEPTEMLLRQSLRIEAVPKQSYNRFVTEQADTVGLDMQVLVSGLAVDVGDAETIAYVRLARSLPAGYRLVDTRFELGEVAEEDVGPGLFTFFVTVHGYAAVGLDEDAAVALVRGQPPEEARERLQSELPLAEAPHLVLWPEWPESLKRLERMPYLPLRIQVEVHARQME